MKVISVKKQNKNTKQQKQKKPQKPQQPLCTYCVGDGVLIAAEVTQMTDILADLQPQLAPLCGRGWEDHMPKCLEQPWFLLDINSCLLPSGAQV